VLVLVLVGGVAFARVADVPLEDPVWWLMNDTPPGVAIEAPTGPLRGSVDAKLRLEPAGRTRVVSVRVDDQALPSADSRLSVDTSKLKDGQHRLEVVVHDTSRRQNLATGAWTFVSDNTAPRIELTLDPSEGPLEGRTVLLGVRADEPLQDVRAALNGREVRLQAGQNGSAWLLHGTAPDTPESEVTVQVRANDAVGNASDVERSWPVRRANFPEDDLDVEPTAAEVQAHLDEDRRLAEVYRESSGPRLWDGQFRVPVQGQVTTAFGTHRSYEYHPGMDFAASLGAPVMAPANGAVVFVGSVPARGNVVILDHGAGVFSTYAHLQRAEVEVGASVKPGQVIGRVGSTGFSTGPHLHWEIWVDGGNVDPLEWTRRSFP
jgi:murein DD-endopeptidase MepM/ murein hydrolase activator NlpD